MELAIAREQTQLGPQDQPSQLVGVRIPVPRLLYRREASDYLATEYGIEVKAEQLASLTDQRSGSSPGVPPKPSMPSPISIDGPGAIWARL